MLRETGLSAVSHEQCIASGYSSVDKSADWVLFDPFACTLDKIDKHDLPLVIKLAFYEPGNAFYMEQNVTTKAIRMQSAASFPPGKRINYTINGPILVDEFEDMGDARSMDVESG